MKWNLTHLVALLLAAGSLLATAAPADASPRRLIQSRHYRIYSDLDRSFTDELARRMDRMYEEYDRRLADFAPQGEVPMLEAHLFARRKDYQRFINDEIARTAGIFIPMRNCLAAVLEGVSRDEFYRTLQHEAFHQFAHNRIARNLPAWLNEGLAEIFEDGLWTGDGFHLGQVPVWRVDKLRRDMEHRRLIDFNTLMHWDHVKWNAQMTDSRRASVQYNQAWAMVHFLVFSTDGDGRPLYRARLIDMLHRLSDGKSGWDAFREAFSDNVAGFQARFVTYARNLAPTDEAVYIDHQSVLAHMLRLLHDEGKSFRTMAEFRAHVTHHRLQLYRDIDGDRFTTAADPSPYFRFLNGQEMPADRHYFEWRTGAPLPDLVAVPSPHLQLRTRFHRNAAGKIETELLIEQPQRLARGRF